MEHPRSLLPRGYYESVTGAIRLMKNKGTVVEPRCLSGCHRQLLQHKMTPFSLPETNIYQENGDLARYLGILRVKVIF